MEDNLLKKEIMGRGITIKLIDGTQIKAKINIKRDPGYDRLSDVVASKKEPFLILFDATSYHACLSVPIENKTLFVNKDYIISASPDED